MTGICRPKQNHIVTITEADKVTIFFKRSQKWQFKIGYNNKVMLTNKYMRVVITRQKFDEDWQIERLERESND